MGEENRTIIEEQENLDVNTVNEQDNTVEFNENTEIDEKQARKERLRARRLERRHRRNARISRCRTFKNFLIWLLGVFFLPIAIVASLFVIPVGIINSSSGEPIVGGKVYVGDKDEYASHQDETDSKYYKDLEKFSVLELARFMSNDGMEYTKVSNFPILVDLLEDLKSTGVTIDDKEITLDNIVDIDVEGLKSVNISSLGDELTDHIEIVATISTFLKEDSLGDFSSLIFTDEKDTKKTVGDIVGGTIDDKALAYYYKPSEVSGNTTYSADTASDSSSAKVEYKPAFEKKDDGSVVLVEELKNKNSVKLYYPPMQDVKIGELKDIFSELFGQTDVEAVFKVAGAIKDGEDNEIIKILKSIYDKGEDEKLLISDLSKGINKDAIGVDAFLDVIENIDDPDYNKNQKMWRILRAATNSETNAEVTAGSLARFDIDQVPLSAFLDLPTIENEHKNQQLYDILMDLVEDKTVSTADDLKVRHLSGLNTNNLRLSVVLKEPSPTVEDYSTKLANYNKLTTVIGEALNKSFAEVKLEDLSENFSVSKIKLTTVLDEGSNATLYEILREATGIDGDPSNEGKTDAEKNSLITIAKLGDFSAGEITLNTVLTGESNTTNKLLSPLLAKSPKIKDLGSAINELDVSEIFTDAANCFTKDSTIAIDKVSKYKFDDSTSKYTLDTVNGEYYISANAKVWLFMFYDWDKDDVDANGSVNVYTKASVKFSNMEGAMRSASGKFTSATVKQLTQTGLLDDDPAHYGPIYAMSFEGIIKAYLGI